MGGFFDLRMEDCGIRTFDTLFSFFLLQKHSLEGFSIVLFWHYCGVYGVGGMTMTMLSRELAVMKLKIIRDRKRTWVGGNMRML